MMNPKNLVPGKLYKLSSSLGNIDFAVLVPGTVPLVDGKHIMVYTSKTRRFSGEDILVMYVGQFDLISESNDEWRRQGGLFTLQTDWHTFLFECTLFTIAGHGVSHYLGPIP